MSEATAGTDTASVLTQFWQELLDVDTIGPDDHLLELGGNSLVATMLANRIELTWGFRPTMTELMTDSFTELSARCDQSRPG